MVTARREGGLSEGGDGTMDRGGGRGGGRGEQGKKLGGERRSVAGRLAAWFGGREMRTRDRGGGWVEGDNHVRMTVFVLGLDPVDGGKIRLRGLGQQAE